MDDSEGEPETINIWELMRGLEEDNVDGVSNLDPLDSPQFKTSSLRAFRAKAANTKISPSFSLASQRSGLHYNNAERCIQADLDTNASVTEIAEEKPRASSCTSVYTVEDVDADSYSGTKSNADNDANEKTTTLPPHSQVEGCMRTGSMFSKCSTVNSTPFPSISDTCVESMVGTDWNPSDLRRALSLKYILTDSNTASISYHIRTTGADSGTPYGKPKSLMHDYDEINSPQLSAVRCMALPASFQMTSNTIGSVPTASNQSLDVEKFNKVHVKTCDLMLAHEFLETCEKRMEKLSEEEQNVGGIGSSGLRRLSHMNTLEGSLKSRGRSADYPTSTIVRRDVNDLFAEAYKPKSTFHPSKQYYLVEEKHSRGTSTNRSNSMAMRGALEAKKEESAAVIFYSSSSQANLKASKDCNAVRVILISIMGNSFDERDISEHPEYDQELRNVLDAFVPVFPTLVIKGKLVVGIDSILHLHRKGLLEPLLKETVSSTGVGEKIKALCLCRGGKFLICPHCKGRGKVLRHSEGALCCRDCSGTGLIKCPNCLFA